METPEKIIPDDSFESSPVLDCSLIQSLKVNTRSNVSPVRTSPMIKSLDKPNKEKPCATYVPSYRQIIKYQDENVTIQKRMRPPVKKKTCKPHAVISSIEERMVNEVKAPLSFHKPIPQNIQMTTLYTNWSLYITFTMIYYIRQE